MHCTQGMVCTVWELQYVGHHTLQRAQYLGFLKHKVHYSYNWFPDCWTLVLLSESITGSLEGLSGFSR